VHLLVKGNLRYQDAWYNDKKKQLVLSKRQHAQEHSTYIAVITYMYESHVQKMTKYILPRFFETNILCMFFFDNMTYICSKKEVKIQ